MKIKKQTSVGEELEKLKPCQLEFSSEEHTELPVMNRAAFAKQYFRKHIIQGGTCNISDKESTKEHFSSLKPPESLL